MLIAFFGSSQPYAGFHGCVHLLGSSATFQPSVFGSRFHEENLFSPRYYILLVACLVQLFETCPAICLDMEPVVQPSSVPHNPSPAMMAWLKIAPEPEFRTHFERISQSSHRLDCAFGTSIAGRAVKTVKWCFFHQRGMFLAPRSLIF